MKLIIAALLIFWASTAHAQQPPCTDHKDFIKSLKSKYGEAQNMFGTSKDGQQIFEVYANPNTGTWSVLVTSVNNIACLVAAGNQFNRSVIVPDADDL